MTGPRHYGTQGWRPLKKNRQTVVGTFQRELLYGSKSKRARLIVNARYTYADAHRSTPLSATLDSWIRQGSQNHVKENDEGGRHGRSSARARRLRVRGHYCSLFSLQQPCWFVYMSRFIYTCTYVVQGPKRPHKHKDPTFWF